MAQDVRIVYPPPSGGDGSKGQDVRIVYPPPIVPLSTSVTSLEAEITSLKSSIFDNGVFLSRILEHLEAILAKLEQITGEKIELHELGCDANILDQILAQLCVITEDL